MRNKGVDVMILKAMNGKRGKSTMKDEDYSMDKDYDDMEEFEVVAEEIIQAIGDEDEEGLAESLKSFIEMCLMYKKNSHNSDY